MDKEFEDYWNLHQRHLIREFNKQVQNYEMFL